MIQNLPMKSVPNADFAGAFVLLPITDSEEVMGV
jgi:hypothetical protein